jgi:Tol biopolymer transport system component
MIAFESSAETGGLYIINDDGGSAYRVAFTPGYGPDGGPSWSPDCTRLVFPSTSGLSLVNPDGTQLERIGGSNTPAWSPDGTKIAYSSTVGFGVMDVASREHTVLASPGETPAWSPDGEFIAFTYRAQTPENQNIYTMRIDGTDIQQLTTHDQGEQWSDWQPLPGDRDLPDCDFSVPVTNQLPAGGGNPSATAPSFGFAWIGLGFGAMLAAAIWIGWQLRATNPAIPK